MLRSLEKATFREKCNVILVMLLCLGLLICVEAELAETAAIHSQNPDLANLARIRQNLLSENKKLRDTETELLEEIEILNLKSKNLEKQLREAESHSTKEEEPITKRSRTPNWWRFSPVFQEETGEDFRVVIKDCHTLGCCFSNMVWSLLLSVQLLWTILVILCTGALSWIKYGTTVLITMDISVFLHILRGLLWFILLNLIAYICMEAKSAWKKIQTMVVKYARLPILVLLWNVCSGICRSLYKALVLVFNIAAVYEQKDKSKKIERKLDELKRMLVDLQKEQKRVSLENELKELKTQLLQFKSEREPTHRIQNKQKEQNDTCWNKKKHRLPPFYVGEWVMVWDSEGRTHSQGKTRSQWRGPYKIVQRISRTIWRIEDGNQYTLDVHTSQMRLFIFKD